MSSWTGRSYFGGQAQQYHEAADGDKKRAPSRLKKSGKKDEPYTESEGYTAQQKRDSNTSNDYIGGSGGGGNPYSGGSVVVGAPYYGGSGYGNNNSPYSVPSKNTPYSNGGVYGGSNNSPYYSSNGGGYGSSNSPYYSSNGGEGVWAPQDGTRSPMIIQTREVHMWGPPAGQQYDNDNDQRRRGGGFFGPALHAVGHFFDRKCGFCDRD